MWTTVVALALALNLEPNRLGVIGFLILRVHPIRQLLVFLTTNFLTAATAGLLILFVVHRGSMLRDTSSSAVMQIGVGSVALAVAAVLFTGVPLPRALRSRPGRSPDEAAAEPATEPSSGLPLVDTFIRRTGRLAHGDSVWLAAALGLGMALPSVDYVALLLIIAASGNPPAVQVSALLVFLVVANAVLLVPILGYLIARERTVRALEGLRAWVLARSRRDFAALLAVAGALMIGMGLGQL